MTAVITGAFRGIGEGWAKWFARQGAHVVLGARAASVLVGLQAAIQAGGESARSCRVRAARFDRHDFISSRIPRAAETGGLEIG
ncbi:MAG: SDR family NAD(P)-dependent oxidoreductase [Verrucomicrobia bacterium]|nr:SDR family NAD(P)-dependent oxidoreductase [Verrucomicrobiota bacterium]